MYSCNYLYSNHLIFIKMQICRIHRYNTLVPRPPITSEVIGGLASAGIMIDSSATRIASCIQIRTIFIIRKYIVSDIKIHTHFYIKYKNNNSLKLIVIPFSFTYIQLQTFFFDTNYDYLIFFSNQNSIINIDINKK